MNFDEFKSKLKQNDFPLTFPGHWLSHQWVKLPEEKPLKGSINPSSGKTIIVPSSDRSVFLQAIELAEHGQQTLDAMSIKDRIELILGLRQALADYKDGVICCLKIQAGKPAWEAAADFDASISYLDAICENGENFLTSATEPMRLDFIKGSYSLAPIGTTIAFLPFSSPLTSFIKYFSATVLAGCPLILCPSSHASLSGLFYAYLAESLEFPQGILSVVFGNFETFRKVLPDKRIKAIIYTGSREHGELLRKEGRANIERELIVQSGGKNSQLIHESADLDLAVKCAIIGGFKGAGQLCTSTSRIFVHASQCVEFTGKLVDRIQGLKIGRTDLGEDDVFMGPMYSRKAVEKFLRYQTMAHREAEKDLLWGKLADAAVDNCLVTPGVHLMNKFDPASSYQSNVMFCPDLAVYKYEDFDQAIGQVNTTDAPFCVSFIGEPQLIEQRRHEFLAPNLLVNMPTVEVENAPVLTGRFQSGQHRFNGAGLINLLTYPQLVRTDKEQARLLSAWSW